MRFLVDAQLPPALAHRIADLGHQAEHLADCGLLQAEDRDIRDHATRVGAIIVTKDEDFAVWRVLHRGGPPIVWLRIGNTRRAQLLRRVEAEFAQILSAPERGDLLVEVI